MDADTEISEVFWHAACDCGWSTQVANDGDTVANKVKTHLKTAHTKLPGRVSLTSYVEVRPRGVLPALGRLPSRPPGVRVVPHGAA